MASYAIELLNLIICRYDNW